MHIVHDKKHSLHSRITKDFDQAGDQGQALISDRLDSVHFLSFIGDEKGGIAPMLPLVVMLNKKVAANRRNQGH